MRRFVFAAILVSFVSPASSARIGSGSVEQTAPVPATTGKATLTTGSASLPGWMTASGEIDLVSTYLAPSSGIRRLDLNGARRGMISTTIKSTIARGNDEMRFDMAAKLQGQLNAKVIRVSAGLDSATFALAGSSLSAPNGEPGLLPFTSTDIDPWLTFRAVNGTKLGAAIDNARATLQPVPLPATAPLAIFGVMALALLRRRKSAEETATAA